jgi:hypothetical protein
LPTRRRWCLTAVERQRPFWVPTGRRAHCAHQIFCRARKLAVDRPHRGRRVVQTTNAERRWPSVRQAAQRAMRRARAGDAIAYDAVVRAKARDTRPRPRPLGSRFTPGRVHGTTPSPPPPPSHTSERARRRAASGERAASERRRAVSAPRDLVCCVVCCVMPYAVWPCMAVVHAWRGEAASVGPWCRAVSCGVAAKTRARIACQCASGHVRSLLVSPARLTAAAARRSRRGSTQQRR